MVRHPLTATLVTALLLAACVGSGQTLTTAAPQPLPIVELKYRVFDHIGRPWYCDPDFYPVQREDETVLAEQRLPEIRRDSETYLAILRHNGMPAGSPLTAPERLAVYRDWKQLKAFALEPDGSGYAFTIRIEPQDPATPRGESVSGTIDVHGVLRVTTRSAADPPMCPICLAEASLIDTPAGPVRVSDLRVGMAVWTQSADGARVAAPILAVAKVEVPVGHEVLRITLADGRTVTASPGHPTADGRALRSLRVGDSLDGARIVTVEASPYVGRTYDILPAGATATYWADRVLLVSSLLGR